MTKSDAAILIGVLCSLACLALIGLGYLYSGSFVPIPETGMTDKDRAVFYLTASPLYLIPFATACAAFYKYVFKR